jgi:hypothetical protein
MAYKERKAAYFDEKRAFQVPRFQLSRIGFVASIETPGVIAREPVETFVKCAQLSTNTASRDEVAWLGWMINDSHKIVPIKLRRT